MSLCLDIRINYFSGPLASALVHRSLRHFSRRASRQALHRLPRRQLGQYDLPLPPGRTMGGLLSPKKICGAPCNRLLVVLHITHVLDPGTTRNALWPLQPRPRPQVKKGQARQLKLAERRQSPVKGVKQLATRWSQQEVEICAELLHDSHDPEQHAPRPSSVVPAHLKAY
jgi:hypothetical protein